MRELEKRKHNIFQCIPTYRGTNRRFYCIGVKTKPDNYFSVSVDRQTFLGFKMTSNLSDTSPFSLKIL